ncbi:MAG: hypothetical protein FGM37_09065 [Phycisphaerales bacterium]|nr:hypothetical protein [Phycisphaerales bacterium]
MERRAVVTGPCGEGHRALGALEFTVVIRRDVGDEPGALIGADEAIADTEVNRPSMAESRAGATGERRMRADA